MGRKIAVVSGKLALVLLLIGGGIASQIFLLLRPYPSNQHWQEFLLKTVNWAIIWWTVGWLYGRLGGPRLWAFLDLRQRLDTTLGRLPWLNPSQRLKRFRQRFLSQSPFRLGYRFWDISYTVANGTERYELEAIASHRSWVPGPNVASCRIETHPAPAKGCTCGLWSKHSIYGAKLYRRVTAPDKRVARPTVLGVTANWGRVIRHADGQRAEKAMVIALLYEAGRFYGAGRSLDRVILDKLGQYYDVPVFSSTRELKKYARAFLRSEIDGMLRAKRA